MSQSGHTALASVDIVYYETKVARRTHVRTDLGTFVSIQN